MTAPSLGPCVTVTFQGRPCGGDVIRVGYPAHGGPVTNDHGYLTHRDGRADASTSWYHAPATETGAPTFVPGPRCTIAGHDH